MEDIVLSVIYALVPMLETPHGSPVQADEVRTTLNVSAEELAPHLQSLQEGKLIDVSSCRDCVSLTHSGVLRVEWLCRQPFDSRSSPRLPDLGKPSA
ncbi:hypothetical protein [Rufibacter hautae]|uniref:ArsR family transcriptional regulator n=1 Tax=Rufibacter hautae TaxID=2595005 RepID=A0A5B6TA28_9BACT|nr:hypothetical protein [Rufibacter hautae]KAA3435929.1 hypothetical protein FOA19_23075 [Rufibacter hautae]